VQGTRSKLASRDYQLSSSWLMPFDFSLSLIFPIECNFTNKVHFFHF
jgi:hypothetical protein